MTRRQRSRPDLDARHRTGTTWKLVFMAATILAIFFLATLIVSVVNEAFGYVAMVNEVDPATLARDGVRLEDQDAAALRLTLEEHLSARRARAIDREKPLAERSREELYALAVEEVVKPTIADTWLLFESVFSRQRVFAEARAAHPDSTLVFRSWVSPRFLSQRQSSRPLEAGVRTAVMGTLYTILITILFAFPIGIAAAVWLEEYARDNALNRFIRVNIYNLAGVPSIIYGMLGLAIFVRALEPITSGAAFSGIQEEVANGRTILSAGLTLALLILPVIIINAQEALRAIPQSLRQSSLAVGATKWQTIWHHVLPASFDRILTGAVLAVSRAIGETAPLVVIGASTFLTQDPTSVFSKFTTLPIQIYQWTSRPQPEFRNLAAGAIVVLLILMLTLNGFAIVMRDRIRKQRRLS